MPSLTIIGSGQVGQTLGYLFTHQAGFILQHVLNTSLHSAKLACDFIGQGTAANNYTDLSPVDIYLISVPDEYIQSCATRLATSTLLQPGNLVFHCSGALAAAELAIVREKGAIIASLHPIKSFIDPALSIKTFSGTFCALEGDASACALLTQWIAAIEGQVITISSSQKMVYHSGLVFASNYLVALTEVALNCLEKAGIHQKIASQLLKPLMQHTLAQVLSKGTVKGLSGPIARGDASLVKQEINALAEYDEELAQLYKSLGKIALSLAEAKFSLSAAQITMLKNILL